MDVGTTADRDGSAYSLPEDLRRPGLLGRFPAQTEQLYQTWLIGQVMPLFRIVAVPSLAVWLAIPYLVDAWVDEPVDEGIFITAWGVAVPLLSLMLLFSYTRRPALLALTVPAGSIGLLVIAFISFYGFYTFLTVPVEAGMFATMIWLTTILPFVRMPFRTTCVLTVVLTVVGTAFLVASVRELHTSRAQTWPYFILILTVVITVPLMSLVGEQSLRKRYVDEQVIDRQQRELISSRALIRRYAPPAVADRLEHGDNTVDSAQRRRVTIFFADVVGFTTMADRLDPEALAEIMNDYLGAVADIVESRGGTLNEFAGDGVMAIFGAPEEMEPGEQVVAALNAARELQAALPDWSRRWYALGIDQDLQARIGINTGVVSIGTFGSAVRATYTGIGLQTNIAARIQAQCPPGSVLLSKTSWHLISETVPCEPRGEVEVKGVHYPIAMYEPV